MLRAREPEDLDGNGHYPCSKSSKTARAYAKTYKPGPPLVPKIMVNRILQYISRIHVRHKAEFVHLVCKYWSLKREARRGAPLLKRLHLEPWTASPGSKQQTDEEKAMKLDVSGPVVTRISHLLMYFIAYETTPERSRTIACDS